MSDDWEAQQERDNDLISCLAHRADDLRNYFRRWIELEIKDLQIKLQVLTIQYTDTKTLSNLKLKHNRVNEISRSELSEHITYIDDAVSTFKGGASDDLIIDMHQLDDGMNHLRGLVRELRDIRKFVYELWAETQQ